MGHMVSKVGEKNKRKEKEMILNGECERFEGM
jgi:hypothetical protein